MRLPAGFRFPLSLKKWVSVIPIFLVVIILVAGAIFSLSLHKTVPYGGPVTPPITPSIIPSLLVIILLLILIILILLLIIKIILNKCCSP